VQFAIEHVNGDLPHYKQIRAFVILPEPLSAENGLLTTMASSSATQSQRASRLRSSSSIRRNLHEDISRQDTFVADCDGVIELTLDHAPCNEIGLPCWLISNNSSPPWAH